MEKKYSNPELIKIRIAFIEQQTTFSAYCKRNTINRGNAIKAIVGLWKGEKATELKNRILFDAQITQTSITADDVTSPLGLTHNKS